MTKDTVTAARIALFRVKSAASSAAYHVEDLTGVRMVRVDEVHYGQEVGLMADAAEAIRSVPAVERTEIAVEALVALEAWEEALKLYAEVDAAPEGMVQVWAAEERGVAAYFRVKALAG
ncbi:hypothetical protein KGD82_16515 [Nocardiopsis eucommiae]|uniref:Uncharacterized protein n=1 Tax=Nocardiopsis eucommiae TaxID=2831970 RepID=A0A975QJD8_9ACTN|nr:hypothetical protein KGD82_16515 [Nocardiopsis eucommiae]